MDRLARLGYAIKGLIYIIIGLIAIQGALGKNSTVPALEKKETEELPPPVSPVEDQSIPEGSAIERG